jgi:hypothetical protein
MIVLYKKGSTSKINGILCDIQLCNPHAYLHLLDQGWYRTPEEIAGAEAKAKEAERVEEAEESEELEIKTEELEIRAEAREAGISHWYNKGIERLEKELEDMKNVG